MPSSFGAFVTRANNATPPSTGGTIKHQTPTRAQRTAAAAHPAANIARAADACRPFRRSAKSHHLGTGNEGEVAARQAPRGVINRPDDPQMEFSALRPWLTL